MMFMVRAGSFLVLVCGCYAPAVPSGVPCSTDGKCPGDQKCVVGICDGIPASGDAPLDDSPFGIDSSDATDASTFQPWAVPIRVGPLSTAGDDFGPSLFANQLRIYFASDVGNSGSHRIHYATRISPLLPFSSPSVANEIDAAGEEEYDAEVAMAGLELHFASTDGIRGLRQTTRATTGDPWTVPPTDLGLNDREGPSLAMSDTRMVVSRHNGGIEEYSRAVASGPWTLVRTHTTLDNMMFPGISNDGLEVYATHKNSEQLFRATRASVDDSFGAPVRVLFGGGIDDRPIFDPELSSNGRTMYLAINAGAGYDIYVTTR